MKLKDLFSNSRKENKQEKPNDNWSTYWNYRIVKKTASYTSKESGLSVSDTFYEIHDFYYNDKDKIVAWGENPVSIYFTDYRDYKDFFKLIRKASKFTILEFIEEDNKTKVINTGLYLKDINIIP